MLKNEKVPKSRKKYFLKKKITNKFLCRKGTPSNSNNHNNKTGYYVRYYFLI